MSLNRNKKREAAEAILVLRAQLHDEEAFTVLVRKHSRIVHNYLTRLVGAGSAEDVLQQTWIKVHRNLPQLQEPRAFRGWLFRIAYSEGVTWLRSIGRRVPESDADATAVEWVGEDALSSLSLQQTLGRLAPAERELLRLRFELGLSYEELAESLQINIGTVRSRLHNTKTKVRNLMEGGQPQ